VRYLIGYAEYAVPINHDSKVEDFLFFVFQTVSWAYTANMNAPSMYIGVCVCVCVCMCMRAHVWWTLHKTKYGRHAFHVCRGNIHALPFIKFSSRTQHRKGTVIQKKIYIFISN
jgi:hypothetical protein